MKKNKKKNLFIILILIISMCFSTSSIAFAEKDNYENKQNEIKLNEFDVIVEARNMSEKEMVEAGFSNDDIALIKSNYIEKELLYRKSLSENILQEYYGYNDEQIQILKSYKGTKIEETPILKGITAELTLYKPDVFSYSKSGISIGISWEWDIMPFFTGTDSIGMYWSPTFGSDNGNLRLNTSKSFIEVKYRSGNITDNKYSFPPIKNTFPNAASEVPFDMNYGATHWAYYGHGQLAFERTSGSGNLSSVDFVFSYGHAYIKFKPSISVPKGGGISWDYGVTEEGRKSGYVDISDGRWMNN